MASCYYLEVNILSATDLKNVNWRHGPSRPYAVVCVDPSNKCSTRVDEEGGTSPFWDETLAIPLPPGPIEDRTLYIDVVHAGSEDDTKPLIGSARLKLRDVLDDAGFDEPLKRNVQLKRPSGRSQGKVEVKVCVREPRYRAPDPYRAPPYGVRPGTREYAPLEYISPYPPPAGGYSDGACDPPPQLQYKYGAEPAEASGQHRQEKKKESKLEGIGMALAVGAGVGALAGFAAARFSSRMEDIVNDTDEAEEEDNGGIVDAAEEDEDVIVDDDAAVDMELDDDD